MNRAIENNDSNHNIKEENETQNYTNDDSTLRCELPILIITKHLQEHNGMKYKDFVQYRRYCTRKLHRLRSLLKLNCGKNKFQRSYIESVKEYKTGKHFLILILLIERCWSFGNELGSVENTTNIKEKINNRTRLHGIRKLKKGCKISNLLLENAQNKCTSRTIVEIKAYQSYILGNYHLKCSNWECAVTELKKSINLYQQLKLDISSLIFDNSNISSLLNIPILTKSECVKIYDGHISELVPLIRLSLYHCKRLGIEFKSDQNMGQFSDIPFGKSNSNKKIVHNNSEYSVPASIFEIPLVELEEKYSKVKEIVPIDKNIVALNYTSENIIDYYSETLMSSSLLSLKINDEITKITANTGVSPLNGSNSEDWKAFELYIREFNLYVSIERDMILLLQLLEYFNKPENQINKILSENLVKSHNNLNLYRKQVIRHPEEGIRVCDLLNFSISELNSSNSLNHNLKLTGLLTNVIGSCRSMFLSHFYGQNNKFQEAYLLCDLVRSRSEIKEEDYKKIFSDVDGYVDRIISLIKIINDILSIMVHNSFNIYLCCILNSEFSFKQKTEIFNEQSIHNILDNETLEPNLMPIAVKPIMFDTAFDFIVPPNISSKVRKNGIVNKIFSKASRKFGIFK
ncbi:signal recognition particle 68 [Cryptosporidium ryanae]|uniref:signal recognition particle 68 n=1 Tax=Cryptosporidium ryanae TaxID=515981 RepID=UPI00351A97EC|nr:signal recognition particle 68 [Cryptosporidium ryanae]